MIDEKNTIQTWAQGFFVDGRMYNNWTKEDKDRAKKNELHLVRPSPKGNAICMCNNPEDAAWIASRLNLAARYEYTKACNGSPKLKQQTEETMHAVAKLEREALEIFEAVCAEWRSDPTSVQCFDLRTVERAFYISEKLKEIDPFGRNGKPGKQS